MTVELSLVPGMRIALDIVTSGEHLQCDRNRDHRLGGTVVSAMRYSEYTDLHVNMDDGSRIWLSIKDQVLNQEV